MIVGQDAALFTNNLKELRAELRVPQSDDDDDDDDPADAAVRSFYRACATSGHRSVIVLIVHGFASSASDKAYITGSTMNERYLRHEDFRAGTRRR